MLKRFLYLFIVLLITSCTINKSSQVKIDFDNAEGLIIGSPVTVNDFKIGEITQLDLLDNGKIRAIIDIKDLSKIPYDSQFKINSKDLLGTKEIKIALGEA